MGGGWGAVGGVKHPFGLKGQCCAFSKCHELRQSTREAQIAVRSSLVPHAVLLTHPRTMKCTLVVSQHRQKAVCKSRPGNLLSSAWCFWIVHECAYHVQAKGGFQLLCLNGRFSKIRSHICCALQTGIKLAISMIAWLRILQIPDLNVLPVNYELLNAQNVMCELCTFS